MLCKEYSQINPANNARFTVIIQCIVVFYNKDQVNHMGMLAFGFQIGDTPSRRVGSWSL